MDKEEIINKKFGDLLVIGITQKPDRKYWAVCKCDCGGGKVANIRKLLSGKTTHCGCKSTIKDGKYHISFFVWQSMMQRCYNKNNHAYKDYGGRGIKVCEEWQTFIGFLDNFLPRPNKDFQIDRINVNGNYEPSNCRWVHKTTNATYNKRNTLSELEVAEIRDFYQRGKSIRKIALFYDVDNSVVKRIINNKSYLNITKFA